MPGGEPPSILIRKISSMIGGFGFPKRLQSSLRVALAKYLFPSIGVGMCKSQNLTQKNN